MVIQTQVLDRHVLENEQGEPIYPVETTDKICWQWKIELSSENCNFGKPVSITMNLIAFQISEINGDIFVIVLILYNEPILFQMTSDQRMMLQNHGQ